jgi:hypothetical protein
VGTKLPEEILEKVEKISSQHPRSKADKAVQLSIVDDNALNSLTINPGYTEDKLMSALIDNDTCKHSEEKFIISSDGKYSKLTDLFIGSNTKPYTRISNTADKENKQTLNIKEEINLGTAEFKNPLQDATQALKEKDAHIEILRRLLKKSIRVIKGLQEQVWELSMKRGVKVLMHPMERVEDLLATDVGIESLEDLNNFFDSLQQASPNEQKSFSKLFTTHTNKTKITRGPAMSSMVPMHVRSKSPHLIHVEDEALNKEMEEASFQMTFKDNKHDQVKEDSTSRSIKDWKTFVNDMDKSSGSEDEIQQNRRHNKTYSMNIKKHRSKPKTDHRRLEGSLRVGNKEDTLDANLSHMESAMSEFLGGFKDIKSELSQIGEAMQSCAQLKAEESSN